MENHGKSWHTHQICGWLFISFLSLDFRTFNWSFDLRSWSFRFISGGKEASRCPNQGCIFKDEGCAAESVGARVWSIVASVSLLSQEVFRGWNDQLSNVCPSILAPFDLWCRLVNLPNLHTPESHDWSSFSPRRWSGSSHVALPCTAKPLVNLDGVFPQNRVSQKPLLFPNKTSPFA